MKSTLSTHYNPYKLFYGIFVPDWLAPRTEISWGAKACFGKLAKFAGKNGVAYPFQDKLAEALGIQKRQIQRYLKELQNYKLIEIKIQGLGKPNLYYFCTHPWMSCHVRCDIYDASETSDVTHHINEEENQLRESININKRFYDRSNERSNNNNNNNKKNNIPYDAIRNVYNTICGTAYMHLVYCRSLSQRMKKKIAVRWHDGCNSLEKWERIFTLVTKSSFLKGETSHKFRGCSLGWICEPKHFDKIDGDEFNDAHYQ